MSVSECVSGRWCLLLSIAISWGYRSRARTSRPDGSFVCFTLRATGSDPHTHKYEQLHAILPYFSHFLHTSLCCFFVSTFNLDTFAMADTTTHLRPASLHLQTAERQCPGQPGRGLSWPLAETTHPAPRGQPVLSHSHKRAGRTQNPRSTVSLWFAPIIFHSDYFTLHVYRNFRSQTQLANAFNCPNVQLFVGKLIPEWVLVNFLA